MSRFVARIAHRGKQESGAVLVITAIMIVVFIGLAALAIDVGSFYQAQRQAQAAADAAALAGVNELPTSQGAATNDVTNYVAQNYPGAVPTTTFPSTTQIKVVVTNTTPSFFGQIFGITKANVSATAIAGQPSGTTPSALFAMDSTCSGDGININGNNVLIPGSITGNGTFVNSGNAQSSFGTTTFGGPATPTCSATPGNATYVGGAPVRSTSLLPWPLDYSIAPLAPTCPTTVPSYSFATAPAPGVYCASGNITVAAGLTLTNVTLEAGSFTLGAGVVDTPDPNSNGLSYYETGIFPFALAGNNNSADTIFAPHAEVQITGDSHNDILTGFVEALDITIVGNNYQIIGTGPPSTGFVGALVG